MPANLQTDSGSSMTELVGGIIHDAQTLLSQQLTLFKQEMKEDLQKARDGVQFLALAAGFMSLGALLLCLMLVHLLHDFAALPLWGGFAIVGGVLVVLGGGLAFMAREQLRSVKPGEKTTQALEENVEWKTKLR
jgi:hypothetical protein